MTHFDKLLERLKNSRLIAILLLVGVGLVAIGNAVDALEKLKSLFGQGKPKPGDVGEVSMQADTTQPGSLERRRLDRELRALEYELAKARQDPEFLSDFEKVRKIETLARERLKKITSSTDNAGKADEIESVITALSFTIGAMKERGWSSKPEAARLFRSLEEMRLQAELLEEKFSERAPNTGPAADALRHR